MFLPVILMCAATSIAAEFPEAVITNGQIKARLYLPDPERGYYRGTRFDWAGVIPSLEFQGHSYFGVWFDKYDPKLHDAIAGPVEEFFYNDAALGYLEAKPGETFVRIGVGTLRKPNEEKFGRFQTYDIVDHGKWTVKPHPDAVEFRHQLRDASSGYAYDYHKAVRLVRGKPELVIEHVLKNTGSKTIETDVYNHNFFVIDGKTTAEGLVVSFPFEPKATADMHGMAGIRGRELAFIRELTHDEHIMTSLEGYGATAADHTFTVENRRTGAGVRVTGDQPMSKLLFWCGWKVLSPEDYIHMKIEPGREFRWRNTYQFYTVKP